MHIYIYIVYLKITFITLIFEGRIIGVIDNWLQAKDIYPGVKMLYLYC